MKRKLPFPDSLKILTVCFFLLFLCREQAWSDIYIKAHPAIGNYVKRGCVFPVCVELLNSGNPINGYIEISDNLAFKKNNVTVIRNVHLPSNSPKKYFLYFPDFNSFNPNIRVSLKSGKQVLAETNLTIDYIYPKDFHVLIFSKDKAGFEFLANPKLKRIFGKDAQIDISYPNINNIPLNWSGYDSTDLIIINNFSDLSFSAPQLKAIREWVLMGGTLFISADLTNNEFAQTPLQKILPVMPVSTITLDRITSLEKFFSYKLSQDPVTISLVKNNGGNVLLREKQYPILTNKDYGKGTVFYFSCDQTKPPFNSWQGNIAFWHRMFTSIITTKRSIIEVDDSNMLSSSPEVSSPPLQNLSIFLFLYILIAGPINYFFLKKRDRMLYSFITIPIIAIVFSFTSYLYGYLTKGNAILFKSYSICNLQKNNTEAPLSTYFSIFSPSASKYDVTVNNPDSIAWEISPPEDRGFQLEWQDNLKLNNIFIDMWSLRRFKAIEVISFPGPIDYSFIEKNGKLIGSISNKTGLKLEKCIMIYTKRVSSVFSIEKGQNDIMLELSPVFKNPFEMTTFFIKKYNFYPENNNNEFSRENMSIIYKIISTYYTDENIVMPIIIGQSDKNIQAISLEKKNTPLETNNIFIIRNN